MGLVFIDLKKAFDTINYGILYLKLEHYGVRQWKHAWLKSYLPDRKQFCRVGSIDVGVPHDSYLGPYLNYPLY